MSTDGRLPDFQWVTNARNDGGTYSGPPYYPYKPRILLHMTVSMGISASYISGHPYPPHAWANPYNGDKFQTIELDRSALALFQPDYGFHWLNKATYCLQTELVGVPVVNEATYTDAHLHWIAENVVVPQERWLRARGLTANIGNYRYHTNSSGSASVDWPGRMGDEEWGAFNGLCAHADAWGNDHWDCSVERLDLISKYALEILGGAPTPKDWLMALTDAEQRELLSLARTIFWQCGNEQPTLAAGFRTTTGQATMARQNTEKLQVLLNEVANLVRTIYWQGGNEPPSVAAAGRTSAGAANAARADTGKLLVRDDANIIALAALPADVAAAVIAAIEAAKQDNDDSDDSKPGSP